MTNELNSKDFDVKKYISAKFKHSNVNDLNDFLVFLNKSIRKHKNEEKNLVSQHFDKFVECRSNIETISNHMKNEASLGKINITQLKNFKSIEIEEYDAYRKKDEIRQRFCNLFTLNEQLSETASYDEFIKICIKAYYELQDCKESKYLQFLFDSSENLRKGMLNKLCCEIEKKEQNIDDVIHFFDLYFKLEAINKKSFDQNIALVSHYTSQNTQKMENTILVNTKYKIEATFANNSILIAIDNILPIICKLIEYDLSTQTKDELLNAYVQNITKKIDSEKYNKMLYSLVAKEINSFAVFVAKNVNTSEKYKFIDKTNQMQNKMVENILYTLLEYKNTTKCFCNEFIEKIQECLVIKKNVIDEYTKNKIKDVLNNRLTNICSIEDIYYIKNVFTNDLKGNAEFDQIDMEEYDPLIQEHEAKILKSMIKKYQNELYNITVKEYKGKNYEETQEIIIPAIMMKIFKIINDHPKSYKTIVYKLYHSLNNNVCKFLLKDLCDQKIELNNEEKMFFYKYKEVYGVFLKQNELETKDDKAKSEEHIQAETDKNEVYRIDKKNSNTPKI